MYIKNVVKLIRPHQYVKNLLIFMPFFFAGQVTDVLTFGKAFVAFLAFSISASAVYILNDYRDIDSDKMHPKKKERPLAAGLISKKMAIILMCIFSLIGTILMAVLSLDAFIFLLVYIILNFFYSFRLKQIAILDVTIIAIGFVLRIFVGAMVTDTIVSKWIVIMTFLLALFLALAKRRDDVIIFLNTGKKMRKVIDGYNLQLIDGAMMIMASVVIVAYILYTTSIEVIERLQNDYLYISALFVILGIMRYLQITFLENNSGSPTKIVLKDRFLQLTLLAWVSYFVWIIYF